MLDLILPNIICFQTQEQFATLNNIRVLLEGVVTFVTYAVTFQ